MIAYLKRNIGEIINIIEGILRLAGSIVSITPTKKDDSVVAAIKAGFDKLKGYFV